MKVSWLSAVLALAGCGEQATPPAPREARVTQDAVAPATAASPAPSAIGTVSGLSGQTSALTGAISDFQVTRTATETRIALAADTLFAFDKADLTPAAEANLARTAGLVAQGGQGAVRVVGHTDAKGDDAYNDALSKRRADAVAAWLRGRPELAGRRFETEGRGKREPVAPNASPGGGDDPQGRARNRRVEVIVPR